jgi:hypothetical protein
MPFSISAGAGLTALFDVAVNGVVMVRFVECVKEERIEIVARDEMADQIVETIVRAAHSGNAGDGWATTNCSAEGSMTVLMSFTLLKDAL